MKKTSTRIAFGLAALLSLTTASLAANPLLGDSSSAEVVGDKELAQVKGSGAYAQYYGYLGNYYTGLAGQYGAYAQYYNYLGYSGPNGTATSWYSTASDYAYSAYSNYYYAYIYSYYNM